VQKDLFLMTKRELSTAQARIEELEDERQQRDSAMAVSQRDSQPSTGEPLKSFQESDWNLEDGDRSPQKETAELKDLNGTLQHMVQELREKVKTLEEEKRALEATLPGSNKLLRDTNKEVFELREQLAKSQEREKLLQKRMLERHSAGSSASLSTLPAEGKSLDRTTNEQAKLPKDHPLLSNPLKRDSPETKPFTKPSAGFEDLRWEISEKDATIEKLNGVIAKQDAEMEGLARDLEELRREILGLRGRAAPSPQEDAAQKRELEAQRQELEGLRGEVEELKGEVNSRDNAIQRCTELLLQIRQVNMTSVKVDLWLCPCPFVYM